MAKKSIKKPHADPHANAPSSSMLSSVSEIEKRPKDANEGGKHTGSIKHVGGP